jgi:hypothetical protein
MISDRRRWFRAEQHVPDNAAGGSGGERQHEHSEEIEPVLDPGHGAAQREDERAAQVEHEQNRGDQGRIVPQHAPHR